MFINGARIPRSLPLGCYSHISDPLFLLEMAHYFSFLKAICSISQLSCDNTQMELLLHWRNGSADSSSTG